MKERIWFSRNQETCNKWDLWWKPGCGISKSDRVTGHVNERGTEGTEDARWGEQPALTLNQSRSPAAKDRVDYKTVWRGMVKHNLNDSTPDSTR